MQTLRYHIEGRVPPARRGNLATLLLIIQTHPASRAQVDQNDQSEASRELRSIELS